MSKSIKLPRPPKCRECKAQSDYELNGFTVDIVEMHLCTCSKSTYRKEIEACKASGGHDPVEVSAGSHSYFVCRKCEHSC